MCLDMCLDMCVHFHTEELIELQTTACKPRTLEVCLHTRLRCVVGHALGARLGILRRCVVGDAFRAGLVRHVCSPSCEPIASSTNPGGEGSVGGGLLLTVLLLPSDIAFYFAIADAMRNATGYRRASHCWMGGLGPRPRAFQRRTWYMHTACLCTCPMRHAYT